MCWRQRTNYWWHAKGVALCDADSRDFAMLTLIQVMMVCCLRV